jgi:hypothetical protein
MKSLSTAVCGKLTFGALFFLSVATAHAQSTGTGASTTSEASATSGAAQGENAASVRYLGTQDDMLIFNVSYDNPEGNKFVVTVKDQDGSQLYQSPFWDKAFYKQFKLSKSDRDKIIFVIRNGERAPIVKTFSVNVNSHFVQEVAVKKLM